MRRLSLFLVLLLVTPLSVAAQDLTTPNLTTPVSVTVVATTNDAVGQSLVYELKERINTSSQMRLVDAKEVLSGIKVNIVTLDPNEGEEISSFQTSYSIVWSYIFITDMGYIDLYLTQSIGTVGSDRVEGQARALTASTNEKVDMAEEAMKNLAGAIMDIGSSKGN